MQPDTDSAPEPDTELPQDYDTPWKIALERHFPAFMAFYFPEAHAQIDWRVPHEFLDKELQAISKDALVGKRHVDKLVKVRRLSGEVDWLCIHIEIQVAREPRFARRMYVYNYRIFDRYDQPAASLAVLGDDDPHWLPQSFRHAAMGCEMDFRFPVAKLAHYTGQENALETSANPFALLTLAYLQNRATRGNMQARFAVKCRLIRMLYRSDWDAAMVREFFLVIDWMMTLPHGLAAQLSTFITDIEEEQKMEYISSVERYRTEQAQLQGKVEGMQGMLGRLLKRHFGEIPAIIEARIKNASGEQIDTWFDRAIAAKSLDEVFGDAAH